MKYKRIKAYTWGWETDIVKELFGNELSVINKEKSIYRIENIIFCPPLNLPILFDIVKDDIIVISANGDVGVTTPNWPQNIIKLYGTNLDIFDIRGESLPFGMWDLDIHYDKVPLHIQPSNLCYANFALNYPNRRHIWQFVQSQNFITKGTYYNRGIFEDCNIYWQELLSCYFNLSPEGNGKDCYRTWETLYLNRYPIVQKSNMTKYWHDLPIIQLDSLSQLTESFLTNELKRILDTQYNMNKLNQCWWWYQIKQESIKLLNK